MKVIEPEDENIRKQLKEEAIKWFKEISNKYHFRFYKVGRDWYEF